MSLKSSIINLEKSPTFALSSSSKELSHSNFWAWLMMQDKEYAKIFFPGISGIKEVKREQGNRDITIWDDKGNAFVIENKLKSIPTSDQLVGYEKKLGAKFKGGVLTAPNVPSFGMSNGWRYISYAEIAKEIEKVNKSSVVPNVIVDQYVNDLNDILTVISETSNRVGKRVPFNENYNDVESIKFDDICKKAKADEFCRYLKLNNDIKQLADEGKKLGFDLLIRADYYNKQAVIDVRYVNESLVVGVQIENKQYRRCVQRNTKTDKKVLYKEYKNKGWFGDFSKEDKTVDWSGTKYHSTMREEFCTYATDRYCFVYQYRNLSEENNSFEEVTKSVIFDMKEALTLL